MAIPGLLAALTLVAGPGACDRPSGDSAPPAADDDPAPRRPRTRRSWTTSSAFAYFWETTTADPGPARSLGSSESFSSMAAVTMGPDAAGVTGHRVACVTPVVMEPWGFEEIELEPGESRPVTLTLGLADLQFWGTGLEPAIEPGTFMVFVGGIWADTKPTQFTAEEP